MPNSTKPKVMRPKAKPSKKSQREVVPDESLEIPTLPPEVASYITLCSSDLKTFLTWMSVSHSFRSITAQQLNSTYERFTTTKVTLTWRNPHRKDKKTNLKFDKKIGVEEVLSMVRKIYTADVLDDMSWIDVHPLLAGKKHGACKKYYLRDGRLIGLHTDSEYMFGKKLTMGRCRSALHDSRVCKDCPHRGICHIYREYEYESTSSPKIKMQFQEISNNMNHSYDHFKKISITSFKQGKKHGAGYTWEVGEKAHHVTDPKEMMELVAVYLNKSVKKRKKMGLTLLVIHEYENGKVKTRTQMTKSSPRLKTRRPPKAGATVKQACPVKKAKPPKVEPTPETKTTFVDYIGKSLMTLPRLPLALKVLYCSNNHLTTLPELPPTLEKLYCGSNRLTTLPEWPSTLKKLCCDHNHLTTLPEELPPTLKVLDCSSNLLTALPELLPTLEELYCYGNQLTTLPELSSTLEELYCYNNHLTTLPELPSTLKELWCDRNQLTTLPELPLTLKKLCCDHNQLTTLPELRHTLEELYCDHNQLTTLPELPSTLEELWCHNNQFATLPDSPAGLEVQQVQFTPSLLELALNYVADNNLLPPKIIELEEKIQQCKVCHGCNRKAVLHDRVALDAKWKVPVKLQVCWRCLRNK
jgi:Leucine Rich repeats (2 copies)